MKSLNEYLAYPCKLEIVPELEEGGYTAFYPDLPGCISCGETLGQTAAARRSSMTEALVFFGARAPKAGCASAGCLCI